VVTSLAICDDVAGVPDYQYLPIDKNSQLTIIVLNQTIIQYSGHGDTASWEVRVVVHSLGDLNTWWWVYVTGKEGVDVVLIIVS
jgi:hypothetical protein